MHPIYQGTGRDETHDRTIRADDTHTGRELRFVMECIAPDRDLKAPFATTVAPELLETACRAIRYFTNTALIVLGTDHQTGRIMIRSVGQR